MSAQGLGADLARQERCQERWGLGVESSCYHINLLIMLPLPVRLVLAERVVVLFGHVHDEWVGGNIFLRWCLGHADFAAAQGSVMREST